jgi:hypothetical protein
MPRYYFNLRDQNRIDPDEDGLELPDLDAAYLETFEAAKEMWGEAIRKMRNPSQQRFEISDAEGTTLLVVPFMEVLESLKGVPRPPPTVSSSKLTPARLTTLPNIMRARQIVTQQTERVQRLKALGRNARTAELLLDVFTESLRALEEKYHQR